MNYYQMKSWRPAKTKHGICIEGVCTNISSPVLWHSSKIVKRISSRVLETSSGGRYNLIGPMASDSCSLKYFSTSTLEKFKNGFPKNWEELLKKELNIKNGNRKRSNSIKRFEDFSNVNTNPMSINQLSPCHLTSPMTSSSSQPMSTCPSYKMDACNSAYESDDLMNDDLKELSPKTPCSQDEKFDLFRRRLRFESNLEGDATSKNLFVSADERRNKSCGIADEISFDDLMQSYHDCTYRVENPCHVTQPSICNTEMFNGVSKKLEFSYDCLLNDSIIETIPNHEDSQMSINQMIEPSRTSRNYKGEVDLKNKKTKKTSCNLEIVHSKPVDNKQQSKLPSKISKIDRNKTVSKVGIKISKRKSKKLQSNKLQSNKLQSNKFQSPSEIQEPKNIKSSKEKVSQLKPSEPARQKPSKDSKITKSKNTLKKRRQLKKLMTDHLKAPKNGNEFFNDVSQMDVKDEETAKVMALFDGDVSSLHQFNLTSSIFSKSITCGTTPSVTMESTSTLNDTAAVILARSPTAARDVDLEIFRINKVMKKTTNKASDIHQVNKEPKVKRCLELPVDVFELKEKDDDDDEEEEEDNYFNESQI